MAFFDPNNRNRTPRSRRLYALYEVVYTAVDFAAAALFVVGSALFFSQSLQAPATWCFLIGSVLFALKPTIRIVREMHFLAVGDFADVEEAARR